VFKWRLQAEEAMWAKLGTGMSNEEVADFVGRYIPAYTAYLPGLYTDGPTDSSSDRLLKFAIDENRSPLHRVGSSL
jgi:D-glycerate 3-kinase